MRGAAHAVAEIVDEAEVAAGESPGGDGAILLADIVERDRVFGDLGRAGAAMIGRGQKDAQGAAVRTARDVHHLAQEPIADDRMRAEPVERADTLTPLAEAPDRGPEALAFDCVRRFVVPHPARAAEAVTERQVDVQVARHHAGAELVDNVAQDGRIGFLDLASRAHDDRAVAMMGEGEPFAPARGPLHAGFDRAVADAAADRAVFHQMIPAASSRAITASCARRKWSRSGKAGSPSSIMPSAW